MYVFDIKWYRYSMLFQNTNLPSNHFFRNIIIDIIAQYRLAFKPICHTFCYICITLYVFYHIFLLFLLIASYFVFFIITVYYFFVHYFYILFTFHLLLAYGNVFHVFLVHFFINFTYFFAIF